MEKDHIVKLQPVKKISPAEATRLREEMKVRRRNRMSGIMRQAVSKLMAVKPPAEPGLVRDYFATVGDLWAEAFEQLFVIWEEEDDRLSRETRHVEGPC